MQSPDCCCRSSLHWDWPEPSPLLLIIIKLQLELSFTNWNQFTNISLSLLNVKPIYHHEHFEWLEIFLDVVMKYFHWTANGWVSPQFPDKTLNRLLAALFPQPQALPPSTTGGWGEGSNEVILTGDRLSLLLTPHSQPVQPCRVICLAFFLNKYFCVLYHIETKLVLTVNSWDNPIIHYTIPCLGWWEL